MIQFSMVTSSAPPADLTAMMLALYTEDPACYVRQPTAESCRQTIRFLLDHPDRGQIILMLDNNHPCGYAILIPYWSNEFAGTVLFIDELFVKPNHRGRGIATEFLRSLTVNPPFDAISLALEVSPKNDRARRLYAAMGFAPRTYTMMTRSITPVVE